jgi:uncharacterized membrane protein
MNNHPFIFALGIGFVAGLRAFTAPAIVAWGAHLGWLNLNDSHFAFMGSTASVIILSIFAIGELIGDKLPTTPKRTAIPALLARIVMGGLCGGSLYAAAIHSSGTGIVLGGIGALIGTFGGYEIRKRLVNNLHIKDFFVAICEDLIAVGLACFFVSR